MTLVEFYDGTVCLDANILEIHSTIDFIEGKEPKSRIEQIQQNVLANQKRRLDSRSFLCDSMVICDLVTK